MTMKEQTDLREFVKRLLDDEDAAWKEFAEEEKCFLRKSKKIGEILWRTSLSYDDLVNSVIVHLKENDMHRLKGCNSPESFKGWLRKVETTVLGKLTHSKEVLIDPCPDSDGEPIDPPAPQIPREIIERLQITRDNFVKLWKEDPQSCFIMFARFELELSSRDVGAFLGIRANHVDVMVNRARGKLRKKKTKIL